MFFNMTQFTSSETYYVTWGARTESGAPAVGAGAPLPPFGKPLGKLSEEDLKAVIEKGIKIYSEWFYLGLF